MEEIIRKYIRKILNEGDGSWLPRYLYHFTPTRNIKSIFQQGLKPKYKPNREYLENEFTSNAVYLTNTPLYDSANLPGEFEYEKSVTILKIDTSFLNPELFVVDDDYYDIYLSGDENVENMGEEIRKPWRLSDCLDKETGVAYEGKIPKQAISVYENLKEYKNLGDLAEEYKKEDINSISDWVIYDTDAISQGAWEDFEHTRKESERDIRKFIRDGIFGTDWENGGLKNIPNEFLLYRVIFLKDINDLKKEFLGHHWVRNKNILESHIVNIMSSLNVSDINDAYVIEAKFNEGAIDIPQTVYNNVSVDHEEEVTIKEGTKPIDYKIYKLNKKKVSLSESSKFLVGETDYLQLHSYANMKIFVEELRAHKIDFRTITDAYEIKFLRKDAKKVVDLYKSSGMEKLEHIAKKNSSFKVDLWKDKNLTFDKVIEIGAEKIVDALGFEGFNNSEDAVDWLVNKFIDDYPNGYNGIPDKIIAYRVLCLKDKEDLNMKKIGEHWVPLEYFIDYSFIDSIGLSDCSGELYIIKAEIPKENIDVLQTLIQNLAFPREAEINLKSTKNIKVKTIKKLK